MSRICIKCGAQLEDNALFCDDCGEKQPKQNTENYPNINNQMNTVNVSTKDNMKQSGFGIASFVLGVISIVTFGILCIPEILGIVFGIIGVCDKTRKKGFALAGLIMSSIMTVLAFIMILMV